MIYISCHDGPPLVWPAGATDLGEGRVLFSPMLEVWLCFVSNGMCPFSFKTLQEVHADNMTNRRLSDIVCSLSLLQITTVCNG